MDVINKGTRADWEKRLDILPKLWYFIVSGRTGMSACSLKTPSFKWQSAGRKPCVLYLFASAENGFGKEKDS